MQHGKLDKISKCDGITSLQSNDARLMLGAQQNIDYKLYIDIHLKAAIMPHPNLLPLQHLPLGEPLPYAIFDADQQLLLSAGQIVHSEQELATLTALGLFYDPHWQGVRVAGGQHHEALPEHIPAKVAPAQRHLGQIKLLPGTTLHIQASDDVQAPSSSVKLIGWLDKTGVLMSGVNSQGALLPLREGQAIKAKTVLGKDVIAFEAIVDKICFTPFPYLHLSWPNKLTIRHLRSNLRMNTQLIASISSDGVHSIPARISNLSASGC